MKRRGWAAVIAGVFIIAITSAVRVFLWNAVAQHRISTIDGGTAQFFGQVFVALALLLLCGVLGIVSGIVQIRSGRRSKTLTVAIVVLFIAAFGTIMIAVSGRHS